MKNLIALCCGWLLLAAPLAADEKKRPKENRPARQAGITIRVIAASSAAQDANDAAQLVPAELKTVLRYRNYGLLDSAYLRGKEDEWLEIALAGTMSGRLRFDTEGGTEAQTLSVGIKVKGPPDAKGHAVTVLETETTVKDGETVVLGASRMQGGAKALIILLTAKLL